MDKLQNLRVVSSLKGFIQQMKSGSMNPNFAWRVILVLGVISSGIIGAGAYFTLNWAQDESQVAATTQKDRAALSTEDLHGVVQFYEVKESTYKALHQSRPTAPNLKMVSRAQNDIVIPNTATTSTSASGASVQIIPKGK